MPTLTAWEPTLHELETNLARPWVLVRDNCGHEQFFKLKCKIVRFSSAKQASEVAFKLNQTLDTFEETFKIASIDND